MSDEKLMELALQARESSYSPYSHFRVGAALLCADDSVYTGCNIENAAFTPASVRSAPPSIRQSARENVRLQPSPSQADRKTVHRL